MASKCRARSRRRLSALAFWTWLVGTASGFAQESAPAPSLPPANPPAPATPSVEDRLRQLEQANRQLQEENRRLTSMYSNMAREVKTLKGASGAAAPAPAVASGLGGTSAPAGRRGVMAPGVVGQPAAAAGSPAPTDDLSRYVDSPDPPTRGIVRSTDIGRSPGAPGGLRDAPNAYRLRARTSFGSGFQLSTEDDEYELLIHNMTAIEDRTYSRADQSPVHSGFYLARERWYFAGRITKPIEYYIATNRSYGNTFDILDAYLNLHYDDRIQLRYGRYRVPYSYEWYANPIQYHMQPERSVFAVNFGMSRMIGFMGWGQLLDRRVDYAVGTFNGARNSYQPFGNSVDVMAFLNVRPWLHSDIAPLRFLNFGGSVDYGNENNPLYANPLRISQNGSSSTTAIPASPAFLTFNNGVTETGIRELWSLHMAYYYRHLSVIAEWESGFDSFAMNNNRTRLPLNGYYVSAGYFLTGEIVEGRGMVKPIHPFELRKGKFGLGAVELVARWAELDMGHQVFTAGLADPNLWTNRVGVLDVGANWHLNEYLKLYFLWEHANFASPVLFKPSGWATTNDAFWTRMMFYF